MRALLLATTVLSLACGTPALAQPAAPPVAYPEGRLDDAVTPSAYRLDLTVDPAQARFSGKVEIDAVLKAPAASLFIHGRDLAMRTAVATVAGKTYPATWKQLDDTGVAQLTFAQPLPAGRATFAFEYDASFGDGPAGMFRVKVGSDWYSWTQFESIDARAAFPSFDEPGFKQPFTVTVRTPAGLKAVSNAPELSVAREGGLDVHRFAETLPLPTYLVAMMVGPFAVAEGTVPPTPQRAQPLPLRIVSTKENAAKLSFALEGSKGIVTRLEDYFGTAFPYPKLDQITSPIMPGAMENAGADLYQDALIVMDENATTAQKRSFGMVVSHELAHQWFGDLVTPAWWDDIWLNESFANWMGYRIGNEWRPDLNIGAGALAEGFAAMNTDALLSGRPIHQSIEKNAQIDAAFDSITYGKGGQVVAMIAAFLGDDKFKAGVRRYMAAHRNGNATSADFFRAMAEAANDPRILPAMQSFTDQQGVPLVTFAGANGRYTVTQSRYARLGSTAPDTRWGVPLCVRRADVRSCSLLTDKGGVVTLGGSGAVMPNAGGTGYYRFELPRAEWNTLIAASASLPSGEALALADSLRASFMAGRAEVPQLVALARTMVGNPDSYASGAAFGGLQALSEWELMDEPAKAAYRAFVGKTFTPIVRDLGFDPRVGAYSGEPSERSQRRQQAIGALSSVAKDPALRARLAAAAAAFVGGDSQALDAAWYGPALDPWLAAGGADAAKALLEKALASQDPVFRPAALGALGASGKVATGKWLLDEVKDSRLRLSERLGLVRGVVQSPETREWGYAWMTAHLDELMSGGGGIFFASRLPQMLAGFCSVEKSDAMARDLRARMAGKSAELELERTIERVRSCGVLREARGAEVSREIVKLR
ncbi:MAG: M1 family metallopeptidase [Novosphingobium sp.]